MLRIICTFCLFTAGFTARVLQMKAALAPEKKVVVATLLSTKNGTKSNKTINSNAPANGTMDLKKLEKIEVNLQAVVSMDHAPEGMKELLAEVKDAEVQVKKAKTEEAKTVVMKNISFQIQTFKKKMVLRKAELEADAKADPIADAMGLNVTVPKMPSNMESLDNITQLIMKRGNLTKDKAKSLAPIVQQLEARLDHLEYKEKNAEMTQAEFAKREKKVTNKAMETKVGDREAKKAKMLMKYLKRKTQRAYKKKVSEWKAEKKALHDAINAIYVGKVDKLQAAMTRLNEVHSPNQQEFLH